MDLIIAMTLGMFIFNAQFAWVNINKIKEIALGKTEDAIGLSQKNQLKVSIDTMAATLATVLKRVSTPLEQERLLQDMLQDVRFEDNKSGYFFIFKGTVNVVMGTKPELQEKDLDLMKDGHGIFVVNELAELARKGGGFLEYLWPKPGNGRASKIGYMTMIPGSPDWIGIGGYTDTSDANLANLRQELKDISE